MNIHHDKETIDRARGVIKSSNLLPFMTIDNYLTKPFPLDPSKLNVACTLLPVLCLKFYSVLGENYYWRSNYSKLIEEAYKVICEERGDIIRNFNGSEIVVVWSKSEPNSNEPYLCVRAIRCARRIRAVLTQVIIDTSINFEDDKSYNFETANHSNENPAQNAFKHSASQANQAASIEPSFISPNPDPNNPVVSDTNDDDISSKKEKDKERELKLRKTDPFFNIYISFGPCYLGHLGDGNNFSFINGGEGVLSMYNVMRDYEVLKNIQSYPVRLNLSKVKPNFVLPKQHRKRKEADLLSVFYQIVVDKSVVNLSKKYVLFETQHGKRETIGNYLYDDSRDTFFKAKSTITTYYLYKNMREIYITSSFSLDAFFDSLSGELAVQMKGLLFTHLPPHLRALVSPNYLVNNKKKKENHLIKKSQDGKKKFSNNVNNYNSCTTSSDSSSIDYDENELNLNGISLMKEVLKMSNNQSSSPSLSSSSPSSYTTTTTTSSSSSSTTPLNISSTFTSSFNNENEIGRYYNPKSDLEIIYRVKDSTLEVRRISFVVIHLYNLVYSLESLELFQEILVNINEKVQVYGGSITDIIERERGTFIVIAVGLSNDPSSSNHVYSASAISKLCSKLLKQSTSPLTCSNIIVYSDNVTVGLVGCKNRCSFVIICPKLHYVTRWLLSVFFNDKFSIFEYLKSFVDDEDQKHRPVFVCDKIHSNSFVVPPDIGNRRKNYINSSIYCDEEYKGKNLFNFFSDKEIVVISYCIADYYKNGLLSALTTNLFFKHNDVLESKPKVIQDIEKRINAKIKKYPIIGRSDEINTFIDHLQQLINYQNSAFLLLEGEQGIGKSALLSEFYRISTGAECYTFKSSPSPMTKHKPFNAWSSIIYDIFYKEYITRKGRYEEHYYSTEYFKSQNPPDVRNPDALYQYILQYFSNEEPSSPSSTLFQFLPLLGLSMDTDINMFFENDEHMDLAHERISEIIVLFLQTVTSSRQIVFLLDNFQNFDPHSTALLLSIFQRVQPVLVVLTTSSLSVLPSDLIKLIDTLKLKFNENQRRFNSCKDQILIIQQRKIMKYKIMLTHIEEELRIALSKWPKQAHKLYETQEEAFETIALYHTVDMYIVKEKVDKLQKESDHYKNILDSRIRELSDLYRSLLEKLLFYSELEKSRRQAPAKLAYRDPISNTNFEILVLKPFSDKMMKEIVKLDLNAKVVAPNLLELIISRSDGNPFICFEYIKSLKEHGYLSSFHRRFFLQPFLHLKGPPQPTEEFEEYYLNKTNLPISSTTSNVLRIVSTIGQMKFPMALMYQLFPIIKSKEILNQNLEKMINLDLFNVIQRSDIQYFDHYFPSFLNQKATLNNKNNNNNISNTNNDNNNNNNDNSILAAINNDISLSQSTLSSLNNSSSINSGILSDSSKNQSLKSGSNNSSRNRNNIIDPQHPNNNKIKSNFIPLFTASDYVFKIPKEKKSKSNSSSSNNSNSTSKNKNINTAINNNINTREKLLNSNIGNNNDNGNNNNKNNNNNNNNNKTTTIKNNNFKIDDTVYNLLNSEWDKYYGFKSISLQEILYGTLLDQQKKIYHLILAKWIEENYNYYSITDFYQLLAHHYSKTDLRVRGNCAKALDYSFHAGMLCFDSFNYPDAIKNFGDFISLFKAVRSNFRGSTKDFEFNFEFGDSNLFPNSRIHKNFYLKVGTNPIDANNKDSLEKLRYSIAYQRIGEAYNIMGYSSQAEAFLQNALSIIKQTTPQNLNLQSMATLIVSRVKPKTFSVCQTKSGTFKSFEASGDLQIANEILFLISSIYYSLSEIYLKSFNLGFAVHCCVQSLEILSGLISLTSPLILTQFSKSSSLLNTIISSIPTSYLKEDLELSNQCEQLVYDLLPSYCQFSNSSAVSLLIVSLANNKIKSVVTCNWKKIQEYSKFLYNHLLSRLDLSSEFYKLIKNDLITDFLSLVSVYLVKGQLYSINYIIEKYFKIINNTTSSLIEPDQPHTPILTIDQKEKQSKIKNQENEREFIKLLILLNENENFNDLTSTILDIEEKQQELLKDSLNSDDSIKNDNYNNINQKDSEEKEKLERLINLDKKKSYNQGLMVNTQLYQFSSYCLIYQNQFKEAHRRIKNQEMTRNPIEGVEYVFNQALLSVIYCSQEYYRDSCLCIFKTFKYIQDQPILVYPCYSISISLMIRILLVILNIQYFKFSINPQYFDINQKRSNIFNIDDTISDITQVSALSELGQYQHMDSIIQYATEARMKFNESIGFDIKVIDDMVQNFLDMLKQTSPNSYSYTSYLRLNAVRQFVRNRIFTFESFSLQSPDILINPLLDKYTPSLKQFYNNHRYHHRHSVNNKQEFYDKEVDKFKTRTLQLLYDSLKDAQSKQLQLDEALIYQEISLLEDNPEQSINNYNSIYKKLNIKPFALII